MKMIKKIVAASIFAVGVSFAVVSPISAAKLNLDIGITGFDGWTSMQGCLDATYGGYTGNCISIYDGCGVRDVDIYAEESTMDSLLEHLRDGGDIIVSLVDPNNDARITEQLCTL